MARSIHYWSDRVGEPFVAVNCKAFASGVLESELFGHERGAFTGAESTRKGVFERAEGGTAQAFGREIQGWSPEVEVYLASHEWPGNVRELENALERAVVLARGDVLQLDDILVAGHPTRLPAGESLADYLDSATTRRVREALAASGGRRAEAAEALGIDRTTLYRLMKKHGIGNDGLGSS